MTGGYPAPDMNELRQWWGYAWGMGHDAVSLWWRVLTRAVPVYMLAWVITQACNVVAPLLTESHPWIALMIVSMGLTCTLSGIIVCLQIMGRELGIQDEIPGGLAPDDDRDRSVTRLIAITLLPFLGIYATFDYIQETANTLVANEIVMRGILSHGVMEQLVATSLQEYSRIGLVLVLAYIARRVVDLLHEKTEFRPLGLLAALLEGFFILILLFTGTGLVNSFRSRFEVTRLAYWLSALRNGLDTSLGRISGHLPGVVDVVWGFLTDSVWPVFTYSFGEPILWLAVTALVFGTHVLSFAEMWRKGEPLSAHLDDTHTLVLDKRGRRRANAGTRGRRAIIEVQEAFFGDLDDKYLPTFQSLRLVLSGGLSFLSAYVVVYAVFALVAREVEELWLQIVGGGAPDFLIAWNDLSTGLTKPFGETLRLAVLAVAFRQALLIFRRSADATTLPGYDGPDEDARAVQQHYASTAPAAAPPLQVNGAQA